MKRVLMALLCLAVAPLLGARTMPLKGTPAERLLARARAEKYVTVIVGVGDSTWKPEGELPAAEVRAQRARGQQKKARVLGRAAEVFPPRAS